MATYRKAEAVVEQYNRDLATWERQVRTKQKTTQKEQTKPPLWVTYAAAYIRRLVFLPLNDGYLQILCVNECFLLALRAKKRKVFDFRIFSNFVVVFLPQTGQISHSILVLIDILFPNHHNPTLIKVDFSIFHVRLKAC